MCQNEHTAHTARAGGATGTSASERAHRACRWLGQQERVRRNEHTAHTARSVGATGTGVSERAHRPHHAFRWANRNGLVETSTSHTPRLQVAEQERVRWTEHTAHTARAGGGTGTGASEWAHRQHRVFSQVGQLELVRQKRARRPHHACACGATGTGASERAYRQHRECGWVAQQELVRKNEHTAHAARAGGATGTRSSEQAHCQHCACRWRNRNGCVGTSTPPTLRVQLEQQEIKISWAARTLGWSIAGVDLLLGA